MLSGGLVRWNSCSRRCDKSGMDVNWMNDGIEDFLLNDGVISMDVRDAVSVMNARGCGRLGRCGLYQYGCAWM